MAKPPPNPEPLRGDAKWRAMKDEIAKRNDAARTRAASERSQDEQRRAKQRMAVDRSQTQPRTPGA